MKALISLGTTAKEFTSSSLLPVLMGGCRFELLLVYIYGF